MVAEAKILASSNFFSRGEWGTPSKALQSVAVLEHFYGERVGGAKVT